MTAISRILSGRIAPAWTAISLRDLSIPARLATSATIPGVSPDHEVEQRSRRPLPLFCLAPHRVFRAPTIARRAVGSYPAFSPLPQACARGGIFSVTLSVEESFRPPSPVYSTRYAAVWCPDFPLEASGRPPPQVSHSPRLLRMQVAAGYERVKSAKVQKCKSANVER